MKIADFQLDKLYTNSKGEVIAEGRGPNRVRVRAVLRFEKLLKWLSRDGEESVLKALSARSVTVWIKNGELVDAETYKRQSAPKKKPQAPAGHAARGSSTYRCTQSGIKRFRVGVRALFLNSCQLLASDCDCSDRLSVRITLVLAVIGWQFPSRILLSERGTGAVVSQSPGFGGLRPFSRVWDCPDFPVSIHS